MRLRVPHQSRGPGGGGGAGAVRAADRRGHRLPVRRQFLSKDRTAQALAWLSGSPSYSGTVAALTARAAGRLGEFARHVREQIAASGAAGPGDAGFRVEGRLAWVHCARTGNNTLLMAHAKRGRQAMEAMGILPRATGVAVHDAWAPYDSYADPGHQLRDRQHDYLRLTSDFRAPPDNNGTERDIRMAKPKQNVSGCLRTMTGARQFRAIRTYLSTAAQHGPGSFDALVMLTEGEPWMPAAA
jgi:Transposase IS66 family